MPKKLKTLYPYSNVKPKLSVKSNTPIKIRKTPPTIFTHFDTKEYFVINFVECVYKIAVSRNGTAKPAEKISKSNPPDKAVADVVASSKTEAKTGPTQGDQPKAKILPIKNDEIGLPGSITDGILIWRVLNKGANLKTFNITNPNRIIKTPPICVKTPLKDPTKLPKRPAMTPKVVNKKAKPSTKATALLMI